MWLTAVVSEGAHLFLRPGADAALGHPDLHLTGGLSHMTERASDLLNCATRHLALSSNDPICAEHRDGSEDYSLQG